MAKESTKNNNNNNNEINGLNKLAKSVMSIVNKNYTEQNRLESKNDKFQSIIDRELNIAKGVSKNSIVDFVLTNANYNTTNNKSPKEVDTLSLFTKDIGDIFNYFQDAYKNKYIEMTDLKFISKFVPILGEAVKVTLDSIVSSDDINETISRNLILGSNITDENKSIILNEIYKIENDLKLLKKLKNIVYKNTLITGKYYVYAASYKEIFEEYSKKRQNQQTKNNKFMETGKRVAIESSMMDMEPVYENVTNFIKTNIDKKDTNKVSTVIKELKDSMPNISFEYSDILSDALEGVKILNDNNYNGKSFLNTDINIKDMTPDGTRSVDSLHKPESFDTSGTYIKYIDAKNIIPIKVLNQIIGYYHINTITKKGKKSNNSSVASATSKLFSSVNMTEQRKQEAIDNITSSITDGILKQFSSKFVSDNSEHKQMIADCIIANGIIDNDFAIQFIPTSNIVEFVINEDVNGNGESILSDALFPGKLLLDLIICKMLNYMNKSGNKNLAHIHKGQIDNSSTNQLNRVVRMMQESNITFNDLLSTNMVFSKFTRDTNIALPTGKNNDKLVEMEVIEGQQIDMRTDYEDKLEQMAAIGSGVPSNMLDSINQVDFAKEIVSSNIKFAGRIASLDADLEEPTTLLYIILLNNSTLPEELKVQCRNNFMFKLPRPRALSNVNGMDYIQQIESLSQSIANIKAGQNQDNNPKITKIKEELTEGIARLYAPAIDWEAIDKLYDEAKINASEIEDEKSSDEI